MDEEFLRWKNEAESLGLEGADVVEYVRTEKERKQQLALETEREKQRVELRKLEIAAEEKRRQEDRQHELDLVKQQQEYRVQNHEMGIPEINTNSNVLHSARPPDQFRIKLPFFDDRDDLESYLITFERTARTQSWPDSEWAPRLGSLLKGKAREVYSLMSDEKAADYDQLKNALLNRFKFTADEYRKRFREAKRQPQETPQEFATKLELSLTRWQELAGKNNTYEDLRDLILLEKYIEGVAYEMAKFILEHEPKTLEEAVRYALLFESARSTAGSTHTRPPTGSKFGKGKTNKPGIIKEGAKVSDVQGKGQSHTSQADGKGQSTAGKGQLPRRGCYSCGVIGHIAKNCPRRSEELSAMVVEALPPAPAGNQQLCDSCIRIPFSPECTVKVEGRVSVALRDTGASMTVIQSDLIPDHCKTDRVIEVVLASSPERLTLPIAVVHLDTPYFCGETEVVSMESPVRPVLIGNYRRDRQGEIIPVPVYTVRGVNVCATVEARGNMRKQNRPLKLVISAISNLTPEQLSEEQKKDATLEKPRKQADELKAGKDVVPKRESSGYYQWINGILYRICKQDGKPLKQVVVPKKFRDGVLRLAHDTPMAGHLGVKKTRTRIWGDFSWPGICGDIRRYCASCDACQRSTPKGLTPKAPLGKMPIINTPFERVAVDLIGPIVPSSDRGHQYVLTMIDYATRYVEAKPLRSIKTEDVAEALWEMWTRLGVPKEILTDRGSQFVSELAQEVNKFLSIRGLQTTPYHAQGNGLVERFNSTIKSMMKRLCQEQPREWDRFIPALLFAIREVPQESLQFSPFELLYGRTVRGPMQILKELWTHEDQDPDVRTTFQYVVDLRNRVEATCQIARENLARAAKTQAKYFNKKAKKRDLRVGDKVLVLLPNKCNKLQMTWKGPYVITDKVNDFDCRVDVEGTEKLYHVNVLKKYIERELKNEETHIVAVIMTEGTEEETGRSIPLIPLKRKEGPDDVCISEECTVQEEEMLKTEVGKRDNVFTDLPGQTDLQLCTIAQEDDTPVYVRQYPVPYAKVKVIGEEVDAMLKMGVIEPAASCYNAPVVLVAKDDGSNRFCIDYRKLNQATKFDAEPIPDINQIFSKLSDKKVFSKIDLSKGYWQIKMADEDKPKTAFTTPQGQFQWKVMPFGLKNAGAIFSRMMRKLLLPIDPELVSNFMDDILIATSSWEEHLTVLQQLFDRLGECQLTARPSKCYLGFHNLSFLGHEIAAGIVMPEDDKLEKIAKAERPRTKKDLRAFLGLAGYYRRFTPNFAMLALPLTDKTKKAQPDVVQWDDECEQAFTTLKLKLCDKPVLIMANMAEPFTLRTDASNRGLGAVLLQEKDGELHPVAYASKKLTSAESHYSTIEKECMGIVWGILKFEPYLYGKQFTIETDHQPLQYLQKSKTENGRLMRWAIQLQQYNFRVKVIAGKDNVGADYLSRST